MGRLRIQRGAATTAVFVNAHHHISQRTLRIGSKAVTSSIHRWETNPRRRLRDLVVTIHR